MTKELIKQNKELQEKLKNIKINHIPIWKYESLLNENEILKSRIDSINAEFRNQIDLIHDANNFKLSNLAKSSIENPIFKSEADEKEIKMLKEKINTIEQSNNLLNTKIDHYKNEIFNANSIIAKLKAQNSDLLVKYRKLDVDKTKNKITRKMTTFLVDIEENQLDLNDIDDIINDNTNHGHRSSVKVELQVPD